MYSAMNNNPISFNDPLGDTVRVDETITGNKLLNSSFNAFAATKEGRKFLAKYAAKGQIIGGHTYKKEGKYSKQGVDVNYNAHSFKDPDYGGYTGRFVDGYGRGQINVTINSDFDSKTTEGLVKEAFGKVSTLFHESFIHADLSTKDYLDNKKFDYSNISDAVKKAAVYEPHYQHYQVLIDYMKNGYNTGNLWPGAAFNGMKQLNDILKVFPSDQTMLNEIWDYSGGIQLDENGKVKQ